MGNKLGELLKTATAFVSAGTIAEMLIDKHEEIRLKGDSGKVYIDFLKRGQHLSIKKSKNNP